MLILKLEFLNFRGNFFIIIVIFQMGILVLSKSVLYNIFVQVLIDDLKTAID